MDLVSRLKGLRLPGMKREYTIKIKIKESDGEKEILGVKGWNGKSAEHIFGKDFIKKLATGRRWVEYGPKYKKIKDSRTFLGILLPQKDKTYTLTYEWN